MMKAFVIREPGGPEKLLLETIPKPVIKPGWVLIKVKAFGLNRSEYFTRIGQSPSVKFPRVLGIECVGEIEESNEEELIPGQKVAAIMGGMGRQFDGSYAEYTLIPKGNIFPFQSSLDWKILGALPEMFQTVLGSLHQSLEVKPGQTLLIRGGTSSIGLCALEIANHLGLKVISTTRSVTKIDFLKSRGAIDVFIDNGTISEDIRAKYPKGLDGCLELIGTTTLLDSLKTLRRGGIGCMTGILGGGWVLEKFHPMGDIPTAVKLTSYAGEAADLAPEVLQENINLVERGVINISQATVFSFEQLQDAHRLMDSNQGNGKIVVVVP